MEETTDTYTIGGYADLIAACDAALNWADANARWFDISTAPWKSDVESEYDYCQPASDVGVGQVYKVIWTDLPDNDDFCPICLHEHIADVLYQRVDGKFLLPTHWRPIQNPPLGQLPAPLERLGEVLRRIKGEK